VLNGAKMWITNGSTADIAIIWAKTGELDDAKAIRGFIVPTDTPASPRATRRGSSRCSPSTPRELVAAGRARAGRRAPPGSGGLKSPLMCLTQARYGIAWGAVGAAMACYDEALSYAKERVQFDGKPIAATQIQQVRLAEMLTEITKAQLLCLQLGRLKDEGTMRPSRSRSPSATTCTSPARSPARRAASSAPTASWSSTRRCATWRTWSRLHVRGDARHPRADPRAGRDGAFAAY
jgi:glutaryl-CoA dehydrogenase